MRNILGQCASSNYNELLGFMKKQTMPFYGARLRFGPEIHTHIPSTVKMPRKMIHGWWTCLNKRRKKKQKKKQKEKRRKRHKRRFKEGCVKILGFFTYLEMIWNCLHSLKNLVPNQSLYKKWYIFNLQVMTFIGYASAYFLSEMRNLNGFLFSKSKWFQKLPSQQNILSTLQRLQF